MKITDRLLKVQLAVLTDKVNGSPLEFGRKVGDAALAAMLKGMTYENGTVTKEWKAYMSLFADSDEQLQRLTTTELDGGDDWLPRIRAYIVANGICFPITDAKTVNNLMSIKESNIDRTKPNGDPLSETVNPTIAALRPIPV